VYVWGIERINVRGKKMGQANSQRTEAGGKHIHGANKETKRRFTSAIKAMHGACNWAFDE